MSDQIRILGCVKDLNWNHLTPQMMLLIQILMSARARYDYFIQLVMISEDSMELGFFMRDAHNQVVGGASRQFMNEIVGLSGKKVDWWIECEGKKEEMIFLRFIYPSPPPSPL